MVEPQFGQSLSAVGSDTRKLVNAGMQRPIDTNEIPWAATMIFRQTRPPIHRCSHGQAAAATATKKARLWPYWFYLSW